MPRCAAYGASAPSSGSGGSSYIWAEDTPMTQSLTSDRTIELRREEYFRAVEVAEGFWMIGTHHRPGFMKMQPVVNNRCLIFRLHDTERGEDVLVVSNGVDARVIPEVRRIERQTGL